MTFIKSFPFVKFGNSELAKYKEALRLSEKENKELFNRNLELQSKLGTCGHEVQRLVNVIKNLDKWKMKLENGEKPSIVE